ncbi:MAG: hypothetical protein RIS70_3508, partial [Planctomycetota bacterium]
MILIHKRLNMQACRKYVCFGLAC